MRTGDWMFVCALVWGIAILIWSEIAFGPTTRAWAQDLSHIKSEIPKSIVESVDRHWNPTWRSAEIDTIGYPDTINVQWLLWRGASGIVRADSAIGVRHGYEYRYYAGKFLVPKSRIISVIR